jgi:hypothetical protein
MLNEKHGEEIRNFINNQNFEGKNIAPKNHYLFRMPNKYKNDFNNRKIPVGLRLAFSLTQGGLSNFAKVEVVLKDKQWKLIDLSREYLIETGEIRGQNEDDRLYLSEPNPHIPLEVKKKLKKLKRAMEHHERKNKKEVKNV